MIPPHRPPPLPRFRARYVNGVWIDYLCASYGCSTCLAAIATMNRRTLL